MTRRAPAMALALGLLPTVALACEIALYDEGYVAPPITVGADCSFNVPGPVTMYTDITGAAPVNIGGGRIGQRVTAGFGCGFDEMVWIVDCNTGEDIVIQGRPSDDMNQSLRAALLYPPDGVLLFSPETTVGDITATVAAAGYDHRLGITAYLRDAFRLSHPEMARTGQPNPACGCSIFYPDSAGASQ